MRSYRIRLLPQVPTIRRHRGSARRMPNRLAPAVRLKVRHVRVQTTFPLARGLPSTTSAARGVAPPALFGSFTGTTPRSDFPRRWLVVVRLLASPRALHLHPSWFGAATVGKRDLPVPDKLFPSMMRSQTAQGPGTPRQNGAPGVAFGMTPLPRHPRLRRRQEITFTTSHAVCAAAL